MPSVTDSFPSLPSAASSSSSSLSPDKDHGVVNKLGSEHPFFTACRAGNVEVVKAFLNENPKLAVQKFKSAMPNANDEYSPLLPAAQKGHVKIIGLLCKHGANRLSSG